METPRTALRNGGLSVGAMMIRLVLSDLDGTLINSKRELTQATKQAVHALGESGIGFTVVSGRPPLGLQFITRELEVRLPFAAFNGGMLIYPDLSVLDQRCLDPQIAAELIRRVLELGLDPWVYQGREWLIRDPKAPHVTRERETVRFDPKVVTSFDQHLRHVVKIVGVSDDEALVARAEGKLRHRYSGVMVARSQNYYLDITQSSANKGVVVQRLAELLGISPEEIVTLGDMPSDLVMFAKSGVSFAMGNASDSVKSKATHVVASNDAEGFAEAVALILKMSRSALGRSLAT